MNISPIIETEMNQTWLHYAQGRGGVPVLPEDEHGAGRVNFLEMAGEIGFERP